MKVKELIERLKELDQDALVFVNGYEGGVDDFGSISQIKVRLNVNEEWYYGKHQVIDRYSTEVANASGYLLEK